MQFKAASLGFIIFIISLAAMAEESNQRNYGVSFDSYNGLSIRKVVNETEMVYAGINLNYFSQANEYVDNFSSNNYSATLGARHYITSSQLSKFINLKLQRGISKYNNLGSGDTQIMSTSANVAYGIEYYISSNLSIEGQAGISVNWSGSTSTNSSFGSTSSTSTSIPTSNIALTYYW